MLDDYIDTDTIKIFPDCGKAYAWMIQQSVNDPQKERITYIDLTDYGITEELEEKLEAWSEKCDTRSIEKGFGIDKNGKEIETKPPGYFDETDLMIDLEGFVLALEVYKQIGNKYKIYFYSMLIDEDIADNPSIVKDCFLKELDEK